MRISPVQRPSRRGIALVITLILLSVTLVMAVAFLALSRRDRNAVATTTDTATARLAADSALAAAQAQIVANIFASSNNAAYDFRLLVSTNFINHFGFVPGSANPTNVNYEYYSTANGPLAVDDFNRNVANLLFLPRAPVFPFDRSLNTNVFRFYLDLNRNGRFETNGNIQEFDSLGNAIGNPFLHQGDPEWIGVLERPDQPHGPNNHFVARYAFLAQPIGNSLDLNFIHNQVMNENDANPQVYFKNTDGFFRNQGVGSWELNLASFLADLNTNIWGAVIGDAVNGDATYYYYLYPPGGNRGVAFSDAQGLLSWRLANNYRTLSPADRTVSNTNDIFSYDNIDGYSDGPLQLTRANIDESLGSHVADGDWHAGTTPWAGSENTNHYFSIASDLFDSSRTPPAFVNRLQSLGSSNATYDRYTFYRMLDQLGTDSSADAGKMNLNYDNLALDGSVIPGAETNMIPWEGLRFFTNAADRMLRFYTTKWATNLVVDPYNADSNYVASFNMTVPFGVDNIPVWVSNKFVYTPAVNRILQLAANLYDASTNTYFPSVFRPRFKVVANGIYHDIYIKGYGDVGSIPSPLNVNSKTLDLPLQVTDYNNINENATTLGVNSDQNGNVYGVPWIIGAKKGFPNFNQFVNRNTVQLTRKLQVTRVNGSQPAGQGPNSGSTFTNQAFIMSITNRIGMGFWNSYNTNYTPFTAGGLFVFARDRLEMSLTNDQGGVWSTPANTYIFYNPSLTNEPGAWPGSFWTTYSGLAAPEQQTASPDSFKWMLADYAFIPETQFRTTANSFQPVGLTLFEPATQGGSAFPRFGLLTTNHVQAYILDSGRVIDYLHFGSSSARDLTEELRDKMSNPQERNAMINGTSMWDTNGVAPGVPVPTRAVNNQIMVSRYNPAGTIAKFWKKPANMPSAVNTPALEAAYFNSFFTGAPLVINGKLYQNTNTDLQAPYTPTRTAWEFSLWVANDPLVHYLASDLVTTTRLTGTGHADDVSTADYPNPNLAAVSDRYQPWGRNAQMTQITNYPVDFNAYTFRFRDSLVWGSDYWNFPQGKYPNIGWIGRVHRGTPWQTVYLKNLDVLQKTQPFGGDSVNIGSNTWAFWTGDTARTVINGNLVYSDSPRSAPVEDSDLFDLFTARLNDNSAHGTLSVNQAHLAAWSAVFSGLVALTNTTDIPASYTAPTYTNLIIPPAGLAGLSGSALGNIVTNINDYRSRYVNADGVVGVFEHAGDILRVPAFSEQSPFLNWNDSAQQKYGISDAAYEWLPQQLMGLLRVSETPRYVIYCYGQALRPAPASQVLSGSFFQMVTNYQVVAESAARAVIRVDRKGTNYTTTVESYNPLPPN